MTNTVLTANTLAGQLNSLATENVPVLKTVVVPSKALHIIAQHNLLESKLLHILEKARRNHSSPHIVTRAIQTIIKRQQPPKTLLGQIIKTYHDVFKSHTVSIKIAHAHHKEWWTKGDTNVVDGLLRVWASIYNTKLCRELLEHSLDAVVRPTPILLQEAHWPNSSGYLYTFHKENSNKKHYSIFSTKGLDTAQTNYDKFFIDIRTFQITKRQVNNQTTLLKHRLHSWQVTEENLKKKQLNTPSLTDNQAKELTKLAINIKQKRFPHQKIHWQLIGNKIFITEINDTQPPIPSKKSNNKKPLVIGKSIQSGHILGRVWIANKNQPQPADSILVVKNLDSNHQAYLDKANAVICEKAHIPPNILDTIRKHHITTIANAQRATKLLSTNQVVVVDTTTAAVFTP